jgi:hypothetical protein
METPPEAVEMALEPLNAPALELLCSNCVIPDLDAFAAGLQTLARPARVKRLLFVADRSRNVDQARRAAQLALEEARLGGDGSGIRAAAHKVQDLGGNGDASQAEVADAESREKLRRCEADLARARTSRDKAATKNAYASVAEAHIDRGDLAPAIKAFSRCRDHCTSGTSDQVETCVAVAVTAAAHGAWSNVSSYCAKAEHALDAPGATNNTAQRRRLRTCKMAAHLDGKRFHEAAREAVLVASGLVEDDEAVVNGVDFVPSQDSATHACLLAVAAFDRGELKRLCVDDAAFKTTLAQKASPAAKAIVDACYEGSYAKALGFVDALSDEAALDPLLAAHALTLKEKAVDRLIAQYCKPYKTVCLKRMGTAFNMEPNALEDRVCRLVGAGLLGDLRVNLVDHALRSSVVPKRDVALREVLDKGNAYLSEVRGLLLRTSCVEHDLVARGRSSGPDRGGGHGLRGLDRWAGGAAAPRRARGGDARLRMMLDDYDQADAQHAALTPRGMMLDGRHAMSAVDADDDDEDDDEVLRDAP